jgi:hypothetical protein
LLANASRVMVWWREAGWRAKLFYWATAVPCAALASRTLLMADGAIIEAALGLLFVAMIAARRWLSGRGLRVAAWRLSLVGAGIGFLSGMVASTGPINVPFFLAHGLVKGAYPATEAPEPMAIGISKASSFSDSPRVVGILAQGLAVGASLMIGSRLG